MSRTLTLSQRGQVSDGTANTITACTFVAWVNWDGFQNGTIIIGTDATGPAVTWSHGIRMNGGKFEGYVFDGSGRSLVSAASVPTGSYAHVACVLQNGQPIKLYVNGALDATSGFSLGTMFAGLDRWSIGQSSSGTGIWTGDLAELAMFRSALTSGEIASLANGSKTPLTIATAPRWYLPLCGNTTDTDNSVNTLTFSWVAGGTPTGGTHPAGIANVCGFATSGACRLVGPQRIRTRFVGGVLA